MAGGRYTDVRNSPDHVLRFSLLRSRKYPRSGYFLITMSGPTLNTFRRAWYVCNWGHLRSVDGFRTRELGQSPRNQLVTYECN